MQGAKAYLLPGVAALLLLAYFLFAPSADDLSPPATPGATPEEAAPAATPSSASPRDQRRAAIEAALPPEVAELPADYVQRQKPVLAGILARCEAPSPVPIRIRVVGAPEIGALVEAVEATVDPVPAEVDAVLTCASKRLLQAHLAAPKSPGRSTIDFS